MNDEANGVPCMNDGDGSQEGPRLYIDGTRIVDDAPCYLIAEIGHNHQGNLAMCQRLFESAKRAAANAVKLQKRDITRLYTTAYRERPYEGRNAYGTTYDEHRESLEFSAQDYRRLQGTTRELELTFFATSFNIPSADLLAELGVPAFKIASGDVRSLALLTHVPGFALPVLPAGCMHLDGC